MANQTSGNQTSTSCAEIAKHTFWPNAPCAGRGTCVSNQCVCPEGWSGNSDFWSQTGYDCSIHDTVATAMNFLTVVVASLNLFYGTYLIWHHVAAASEEKSGRRGTSAKRMKSLKTKQDSRNNKVSRERSV